MATVGSSRLLRSALLAGALLAIASLTRPARAGAFDLNDTTWEGCSELLTLARNELGAERVIVQSVLDWQELKPVDGVLLIHPMRVVDAEEATAFMRAGGRLAVADDYGLGDRLLEHFRIRRRTLPDRPLDMLRSKPALPIAQPASDPDAAGAVGLHPTVAFVEHVALNHGTGLTHPDLTPVLAVRGVGEERVDVAVAGQVDAGRLLAMGDSSAFINQMLRYPGNRRFAVGVVHYLVEGERPTGGTGRLWIIANQFNERVGFGGVMPWRKSVDRRLAELRDGLASWRRDGVPDWAHTLLAVLAALSVLWWAGAALLRVYRSRVPRFARPVPLVAQGGLAGRMAVLASPTSPAALALLELRSALTESLAHHLDLPVHTRPADLVDEAGRRTPLEPATRAAIRRSMARMRRAELGVVSGTPPRVTQRDVAQAARAVDQVLRACGADRHPPRRPGGPPVLRPGFRLGHWWRGLWARSRGVTAR